jgi:putative FmdB family regulatory protein
MAIYEYKCPACGHTFECLQPMDAEKTTACLRCPSKATRMISAGSPPIFKGTGFPGNDLKKAREQ